MQIGVMMRSGATAGVRGAPTTPPAGPSFARWRCLPRISAWTRSARQTTCSFGTAGGGQPAGGRDARHLGGRSRLLTRHRGGDEAGHAPAAGRLHQLSQPGHAGEDRRQARRDQRRPIVARPGRRLARAGVHGLRLPLRPPRQPLRGSAPDHGAAAEGRVGHLSRASLLGGRLRDDAARPATAGSADLDWRPPTTNARAGGEVCRCLPHRPCCSTSTTRRRPKTCSRSSTMPAGRSAATPRRCCGRRAARWPSRARTRSRVASRSVAIRGSTEEIVEKLAAYAAVGVTHFTCWMMPLTMKAIERLAPIVEAAHKL